MAAYDSLDLLLSPGQLLREELSKIIPYDANEQASTVSSFDKILKADGELSKMVYDSTLNYMVRRLVTSAEYLKRKYFDTTGSEQKYWVELRRYLRDHTEIPQTKLERIFAILLKCIEERNKVISPGTRNRVIGQAKQRGMKCYICGRDVLYNPEDDPYRQNAEIEHIWPKSLGGSNNETNLKISCTRCNKLKDKYIDYSDFHYELMCAVTDKEMESFDTDFDWSFRVPVLAKSNFSCSIENCDNNAAFYGKLQFSRLDASDTWHFLNISAYCERHLPKRR